MRAESDLIPAGVWQRFSLHPRRLSSVLILHVTPYVTSVFRNIFVLHLHYFQKTVVEVIWGFKGVFMFVVTDSTSASLTAETL